ncbi:tRNA (adenosine(37)-N6)-threonylcarbamoyltransferase complex transferase subunit TsaD [Mesomycoplasma ovipneumoniae]|uniref:tRNA N6-adenosine threonylcarbamoyltransferase n=1 Tax=Mesomycoplasma ovipneumoniae TaxID=29562 RepID=A0AAP5Y3G9_9BACT|nr:tRNA (adenosine(37)-N6)-threonylcarbamoyltransferase complex transferase subunit TsaD [Mesomycoplasma ovipneumoniae]MDW2907907.1 tRNA (adenosine(37)-N6)-threonylcarbamoyltransferase complex transferase subunit TsaD [Mesomycoplasma ovipneumoniae]MDW2910080.1 tRNA (adenosine(37)-N6)-threonylcarbamoyltransferase complex transferase subunit TsaD [Mesomycoplasma ovipneumoniae]MDW2912261.1 tRNA (adenosine(37)-N6)-threonylcarbamoyltransferase complex transferase subunit TsaD [Mesomycoplasma ovipneum
MKILGIETSHDDASVALLSDDKVEIILTISQIEFHQKFGGTIPELAAREHSRNLAIILEKLLQKRVDFSSINAIAYTNNPGLLGALKIGFLFANALSLYFNKPLIPINHLLGHFWSANIDDEIVFPALSLLISGGHSQWILAKNESELEIIGSTVDDALGEIYDKIGRNLGLVLPGGPKIDQIWQQNRQNIGELINFSLPKRLANPLDFSFSGLKTQVINFTNQMKQKNKLDLNNVQKIAVSFQETIIKYLKRQLDSVLNDNKNIKTLTLVGGVAANSGIRALFKEYEKNYKIVIPKREFCTDNGAMIAKAAQIELKIKSQKQKLESR